MVFDIEFQDFEKFENLSTKKKEKLKKNIKKNAEIFLSFDEQRN